MVASVVVVLVEVVVVAVLVVDKKCDVGGRRENVVEKKTI